MNRTKFPSLRIPVWPLASSAESAIGCGDVAMHYGAYAPPRSIYIPLRSEHRYETLYVVIGVFFFEDGECQIEANLKDVYRESLRSAQALVKLLEQIQKRIDKALADKPACIPVEHLADTLMEVFAALSLKEVIEYRGIGVPDVVRPLAHSDISRYVTVAERIVSNLQRKAA